MTWLDYYIKGARAGIPAAALRQLPGVRTDLDAMRLMIAGTIQAAAEAKSTGDTPELQARLALYTALAPLLLPGGAKDPLCLMLTPELAADLAEAKAPDTPEPDRIIEERGVVYLDLPHRALLIGHLQVRAIVIKATPGIAPLVTAILTEYGENPMSGRYGWDWGREGSVYGSAMEDVDLEMMREQVEDLVRLALLYWASGSGGSQEQLPHVSEERLAALKPEKQSARQKTHSLFRVARLSSPPDRFGRGGGDRSAGGWALGVRVRVRGHFRWQPHGPERALRRLQWIAAHERGPSDGETRPDLHVLRGDL